MPSDVASGKQRSLAVGGLPGTGTTTACRKLAEVLDLPHHYSGQIFRDMAKERNLTLAALGDLAERDPTIDRIIDDRQVELLRTGPVILEGRLAGFLAHRDAVDAYKVWFHAEPYVRAERITRREGGDVEERMAEMRIREASERKRYLAYYGFDVSDLGIYDLVVDSTDRTPLEVVEDVHNGYTGAPGPRRWYEFWRA
jgi:predicted cytidylate kinase